MGRPSEGPRVKWKRGWAYSHFTWDGELYRVALKTKDKREAQEASARAYADVVSGRRRPIRRQPGQLLDLAEMLETWIESKRPSLDPDTMPTLDGYARRFVDSFGSLDQITEATGTAFGLNRLSQALRTTVNRELSYLREFLRWARVQGAIAEVPFIPRLPPKAQGKRTGPQRAKSVHISEAEAMLIIAELPEESKKIDGRKWPIRDRFAFMWETALRPETISRLSVPDHWRRGMRHVELTNEDDKARWGREVDLSETAIEILERVAPLRGLIFGDHSFYKAIKRAAAKVLGAIRGKHFAPYDFRHGRAKSLLDTRSESGERVPIRGVSYLLGHKRVSTTDKYLAPERGAGREALTVSGAIKTPNKPPKKRRSSRDA